MWGAHNWNAMAYSPIEKLSYIPVIDVPAAIKNDGSGEFPDDNIMLTEVDGKPFAPGKLVAFDPVAGRIRWTVEHALPYNGGVMATAGGLVFQGDAQGDFVAYAANSGEKRWSVHLGAAAGSAPSSYALDGRQYIVVPVGGGGGLQFYYPQMHASRQAHGPVRLFAFTLDENAPLPAVELTPRRLPEQPPLEASAETVAEGKRLYADGCKGCHGFEAVARVGGSVPDLRYASAETHRIWSGIVIGGAKRANGMPAFELPPADAEAIRAYVLSLANELRRAEASSSQ
jgi:quinohemoprotein ethanol dehydrogenase